MTDLDALFDELFPICRSITGEGIRTSMHLFQNFMPFRIEGVASGTPVFDWVVPPEWSLRRATLYGPDGSRILDTADSNLHVVNFSEPFKGTVSLAQLQEHLHSIPEMPDAIPYVTSYYNRRWGLCLTDRQRRALQPGNYAVHIDTEIKDGELNYAVYDLPGETDETVLISSYLCHPSLANNELSGPLALLRVYELLRDLPRRRYSYRFLLIPETIGSITYIAKQGKALQDSLVGGIVLTCMGGASSTVSLKLSRRDWVSESTQIDKLARHLAEFDQETYSLREFTPTSGSDERQFCSPGVNWPVIQAARTVYGEYAEYHTSADTKDYMTIKAVEDSADKIFGFLQLFEIADLVVHSVLDGGEPQLGKRDLYPTVNSPISRAFSNDATKDGRYLLNLLLNVLSLSDGKRTILGLSQKLNVPTMEILKVLHELQREKLIVLRKDINR